MAGTLSRFALKYIVGPPLVLVGKVLGVAFGPVSKALKVHFARQEARRLEQDIRNELPFLFSQHQGRIVPTPNVPLLPGFDYAFVTVEVMGLRIRFCRGRGELDVGVGAHCKPYDIYDLRLVLSLLDDAEEPDRGAVIDLGSAARLLRDELSRLNDALGGRGDEVLLRRLAQVAADDRAVIKEAEWEIRRQTGGGY